MFEISTSSKKNKRTFCPYCYWCHKYLGPITEEVYLHVFRCHYHPLIRTQDVMTALDWGRIRCHCSIYQKIQDHLEGQSQYRFPLHSVSTSVQTESRNQDASVQTGEMSSSDAEADTEAGVEADTEADVESDAESMVVNVGSPVEFKVKSEVKSEDLFQPILVVPKEISDEDPMEVADMVPDLAPDLVPEMVLEVPIVNQSTLSFQFSNVQIQMSVRTGGRCTATFEDLEFELL